MRHAYKLAAASAPPTPPDFPSIGFPSEGSAGPPTIDPTVIGPWWFHAITSEVVAVIEGAGLVPADATTQLRDAIEARIAALIAAAAANRRRALGTHIVGARNVVIPITPSLPRTGYLVAEIDTINAPGNVHHASGYGRVSISRLVRATAMTGPNSVGIRYADSAVLGLRVRAAVPGPGDEIVARLFGTGVDLTAGEGVDFTWEAD